MYCVEGGQRLRPGHRSRVKRGYTGLSQLQGDYIRLHQLHSTPHQATPQREATNAVEKCVFLCVVLCLGVLVTWYDDIMEIFTVLGVGNKVFIRLAWLGHGHPTLQLSIFNNE